MQDAGGELLLMGILGSCASPCNPPYLFRCVILGLGGDLEGSVLSVDAFVGVLWWERWNEGHMQGPKPLQDHAGGLKGEATSAHSSGPHY